MAQPPQKPCQVLDCEDKRPAGLPSHELQQGDVKGSSSEAATDGGSPPVLVLSSTGPAAERQSGSLGVFDYLKQYNNSPAYRQRHTAATVAGEPLYLYRAEPGIWCVGPDLGGPSTGLANRTNSGSVPPDNWLCSTEYSWQSDPTMSLATSLPSVCGMINITLLGAAAKAPETEGKYSATGQWSAGRPVFSNGRTYLRVRPGANQWEVTDQVKKLTKSKILSSSATTSCPASNRAGTWKYWDYWTFNGNGNAQIWLSCTYHPCDTQI